MIILACHISNCTVHNIHVGIVSFLHVCTYVPLQCAHKFALQIDHILLLLHWKLLIPPATVWGDLQQCNTPNCGTQTEHPNSPSSSNSKRVLRIWSKHHIFCKIFMMMFNNTNWKKTLNVLTHWIGTSWNICLISSTTSNHRAGLTLTILIKHDPLQRYQNQNKWQKSKVLASSSKSNSNNCSICIVPKPTVNFPGIYHTV